MWQRQVVLCTSLVWLGFGVSLPLSPSEEAEVGTLS